MSDIQAGINRMWEILAAKIAELEQLAVDTHMASGGKLKMSAEIIPHELALAQVVYLNELDQRGGQHEVMAAVLYEAWDAVEDVLLENMNGKSLKEITATGRRLQLLGEYFRHMGNWPRMIACMQRKSKEVRMEPEAERPHIDSCKEVPRH